MKEATTLLLIQPIRWLYCDLPYSGAAHVNGLGLRPCSPILHPAHAHGLSPQEVEQ